VKRRSVAPIAENLPRPVTAQPVGMPYAVQSNAIRHPDLEGRGVECSRPPSPAPGCYRKMPTCRD
jgi:hypothetical protein